ncbi:DUF6221 family protein [Streptomyces sp. NPDC014748]|uniref:DUF6221 family protein n=1 Tax=Streptomyces sp. NPDC014748 TaxID=3364905 RepID=UPI0036F740BB
MTADLVEWLRTQLDTDERVARAATPGPWEQTGIGEYGWGVSFGRAGAGVEAEDSDQGRADADHIAAHDPARVLREIDAKRATLAQYAGAVDRMDQAMRDDDTSAYQAARVEAQTLQLVIRRDAAVYSDRPGYRPEWRP